jgi:hypothetical protein
MPYLYFGKHPQPYLTSACSDHPLGLTKFGPTQAGANLVRPSGWSEHAEVKPYRPQQKMAPKIDE